jgi:CoA:oxalate CoA-transferase
MGKTEHSGSGALDGIRVLDLGLLVQGPQAALLLADLGADVIKVELPLMGDQARWLPISAEDERAPWFIGCNRGKKSITLDLHKEEGQEVFLKLVETADVVVSNFTPGTMENWGLGYENLAERNPGIIFGAASAFGPLGPDSSRSGADICGQAAGGMLYSTGTGPEDMTPIAVTLSDHIGSQNLVSGILAALYHRERTGSGQKVEVSLLGGQIYAQTSEYTAYFLSGNLPNYAQHGHPLLRLIYGVFPTSDGQIALAGVDGPTIPEFFEAIGRPEMTSDPRFETGWISDEHRETLFEILAEAFQTKTTAEWESTFSGSDLRFAAVRNYAQVGADVGAFINGYLQRVDHPEWGSITMVGFPIRLSRTPATPGQIAPELGQHTEELLLELEYDWDRITTLREKGVI